MASTNGNPGRLAGKTAVITGGSSGLGLETAKHFVALGARVIVTGTNEERLAKAVAVIGDGAVAVRADVRQITDLEALAERVRRDFGTLDILFANAGLGFFAPVDQVDEAFFDDQFDTNVKGVFFTVRALLPALKDGASVILNASAVNQKGFAGASVYNATKAAVRSLARSLAAELGPRGIRVNALSPGLVMTNFQEKMGLDEDAMDQFVQFYNQSTPLGRLGIPAEIASAAVFLASDESAYVSGADLTVDGGFMNV